ncbi:MetQ/NlpA family ABC transporter substrate-binding protein [Neomicrococcus aestuarii]|uniref:Metal ABC transporter substrate-binding protein n=1 Tax=Neomicrococcus aestuarii TaxID=556325 RepID=A0A1L2ZN11_9MICC|nr:MetQ/NlpA family ABC transporter substrate-binding protein [Neomicrococcus aestuarii]APF40774.1 hypothetical protein BHE16_06850 [Neomicrococcus aestuarii]
MQQNSIDRRVFLRGTAGLAALTGLGALTGCGLVGGNSAAGAESKTITLIATESAPYQEPSKIAGNILKEQGWDLKVTYVTDIVQPNQAVDKGEYDANYFQHGAYLSQFNKDNGLDLEMSFYVYSSPAGLFSKNLKKIEDLPTGAKIALPVDPANNGRGLRLLAEAGLLEIDTTKSVIHLSQQDITANPRKFTFVEVDQQSLATTLPDVDAGFLFVRLAGELGYTPDDALAFETIEEALPYICGVAGKPGFAESEKGKALKAAYQSDEVREWFKSYINGALGTPWDRDPAEDKKEWDI